VTLPLPPPPLLPCPPAAGWELVSATLLPRRDAEGRRAGGFSAAVYLGEEDRLWLLSDAPRGRLSGWTGLAAAGEGPAPDGAARLRPLQSLDLEGSAQAPLPAVIDGEGLVIDGDRLWVASEGRRTPQRTAALYRFGRADGRLEATLPLPPDWQPGPGRGLAANQGPESLTLLRRAGAPSLLTAAESPLLQDPPGRARLLAWPLDGAGEPAQPPLPLRPLGLPARGDWGLTELMAVPGERGDAAGLLALQRRFEAPDRWGARLAFYPVPGPERPDEPPLAPLFSWNLLQLGVPADNWEGMTAGPPLSDGRPTLVLVSDDNFSPLQNNHLVRLAPRRAAGCTTPP
jgi:hypothetical protein